MENGGEVNINESIVIISNAIELMEKSSLFSRNEDLDDISTTNLKVSVMSIHISMLDTFELELCVYSWYMYVYVIAVVFGTVLLHCQDHWE